MRFLFVFILTAISAKSHDPTNCRWFKALRKLMSYSILEHSIILQDAQHYYESKSFDITTSTFAKLSKSEQKSAKNVIKRFNKRSESQRLRRFKAFHQRRNFLTEV